MPQARTTRRLMSSFPGEFVPLAESVESVEGLHDSTGSSFAPPDVPVAPPLKASKEAVASRTRRWR